MLLLALLRPAGLPIESLQLLRFHGKGIVTSTEQYLTIKAKSVCREVRRLSAVLELSEGYSCAKRVLLASQ